MNFVKLARRNLTKPLEQRLSVAHIRDMASIARTRGNNAALMQQIHVEIAPKLAEMARRELALSREKRSED